MMSRKMKPDLHDFSQIVARIWKIVQDDDQLEAFDLIPPMEMLEEQQSPLRYECHNMALERWCVKDLSLFVYHDLFQKKLDIENQKAFLTTALLLNCNIKTFWNMRRELVLQNHLVESVELRYVNFVLSFWPKCADAIFYKKWLLKDKLIGKPLEFFTSELDRIAGIADHRENNLFLWDYCVWLYDQCQLHPDFVAISDYAFKLSDNYMSIHPSDASQMSYRQRIINRFILHRDRLKNSLPLTKAYAVQEEFLNLDDNDTFLIGLLINEFDLNRDSIAFWSDHEGIWSYLRFLTWCWLNILPKLISPSGRTQVQQVTSCPENICPFRMYFFSRIQPQFLNNSQAGSFFVQRYKKWIDTFL